MNVQEFISLNYRQRYELWENRSVKIAAYRSFLFKYTLYSLGNFYVELKTFRWLKQKSSLKVLNKDSELAPYLRSIDLQELGMKNRM